MSSLAHEIRELDLGSGRMGVELAGAGVGAVAGGSLIALDEGVSEQHRRDVLQSTLLAQLAASAKANRHADPVAWYRTHQSTLELVGWVVSSSANFVRYFPQLVRFTIANVVADVFRPRVSGDESALIRRTLATFSDESASATQAVWECPSHAGGLGNFQVGLATEDDDIVTLQLGRFMMDVPRHVTRLALEEFGGDARFSTSLVDMTLNEQVYAQVRSSVADKLQGREALIAIFELAGREEG